MNSERVIPEAVFEAFGVDGPGQPLEGGQGSSVRVGDLVLKPVADAEDAIWCAQMLDRVAEDGFRVAKPVAASDGRWVVDGWAASQFVDGLEHVKGRWPQLFDAARAFHAATASEPAGLRTTGPSRSGSPPSSFVMRDNLQE